MKKNYSLGIDSTENIPIKHFLLIMRITLILLFAFVFCSMAETGYSQNARVTINKRNVALKEVLNEIESQTDYLFIYNNTVNTNQKVSLKAKQESVANVLSSLLNNKDMSYSMEGNHIILSTIDNILSSEKPSVEATGKIQQQKKKITGTVVDEMGEPIIGANIVEVGTTNGNVSDYDGNFTLEVANDAVIRVSYIGYLEQDISTAGKNSFNITLKEDMQSLEELVVVGYGVQKKVNLTGAVAMIDGEELSRRPVTNVTQSLQGVIPGLNASIGGSGGTPGQSYSLNIRGQGNLSGSDSPYVLVDGVEMSLSDVNPNDIASISVLKDAAAAAIYGARAAYGVILVTTKKGKDGKMSVSYQGTTGWSEALNLPEMANGYDFARFFNAGNINAGVAAQYSDSQLETLKQYVQNPAGINSWPGVKNNNSMSTMYENNSLGVGNTDWFKFHYKNYAFKQDHNVSFSGGSKAAQYYVSGGYYGEEGLLRYADINYERFNLNASLNSQLTDWLKFKFNTKYSLGKKDSPFGAGALNEGMFYHGLARFRATVSPYDLNGNFTELSQVPYLQSGTYSETINSNSVVTGGFELEPIKNWNIILDYTYRRGTTDYEALATPATFIGIDGTDYKQNTRSELGIPDASSFRRSMAASEYQTINLFTNYTFTLADKNNFVLMGGYQEEDYNYKQLQTNVVGLISTSNPGINVSTGDKVPTESRYGWATRGFFGRINYDFEGKYLLELNGRYDGSSRFASSNRWGWFPSISAGWNVTHEPFMQPVTDVLNSLKIRASYGNLGNQSGAGLYTFAETMAIANQGNWYFQDGRDMIIWGPGPTISNVTWEKVESKNLGVDFGLFNNKLTGTVEVFERITKDMLGPSEDVADMYGANVPNSNNAVMKSRGWEFSVNYRGKIGKDINYSVGGMVTDAQSTVLKYSNPTFTNPSGNWYEGRNAGEIWGYKSSGIIQTQAEADAYNDAFDTSYLTAVKFEPGDLKFLDLDGNNKINRGSNVLNDMGDMSIIGNTTPRYLFSLNGSISYKDLSLSMLFQGVGKRDYSPAGSSYFSGGGSFAQATIFKEHLDYWSEDNPNAYFTKPYISGAGNNGTFNAKTINNATDYYLQDASYLRLKNLTISYNLPQTWMEKVSLSKAQVFVSGENLFTISKMIGFFDPELVFVSGDGGKNYPLNRVYSVGLIINL